MIFSRHAQQRWAERCAGLDPAQELRSLRRPGKKLRALLEATWRRHHQHRDTASGRHYLVSPNGVVLVVGSAAGVVVTVLLARVVKAQARRERRRSDWDRRGLDADQIHGHAD